MPYSKCVYVYVCVYVFQARMHVVCCTCMYRRIEQKMRTNDAMLSFMSTNHLWEEHKKGKTLYNNLWASDHKRNRYKQHSCAVQLRLILAGRKQECYFVHYLPSHIPWFRGCRWSRAWPAPKWGHIVPRRLSHSQPRQCLPYRFLKEQKHFI